MRSVLSVCFLAVTAVWTAAAADQERPLTVVVQAEQALSAPVLREMRFEMERLFGSAGLPVEFRLRSEVRLGDSLDDLVLATFKGRCSLDLAPSALPLRETPALAYTHVTDGQIQPFTVVLCDRVAAAIRPAMWGSDFRRTDALLGRALARVLAHEIFHIVGKEHEHSREGVFRHALSGRDLIAESLEFHPREIRRLREYAAPDLRPAGTAERAARD